MTILMINSTLAIYVLLLDVVAPTGTHKFWQCPLFVLVLYKNWQYVILATSLC